MRTPARQINIRVTNDTYQKLAAIVYERSKAGTHRETLQGVLDEAIVHLLSYEENKAAGLPMKHGEAAQKELA